ncbi:MAG: glycosyltransferase, partial [Anaerolineales bacterium]
MPMLFIGMPVFNGGKFIAGAMDSLIAQTFTDWTLLISDNCSTDNTRDICESYCSKDARIQYIKQDKNIGAIDNFKYLLEQANAPFFMWAAADDLWEKNFISVCIKGLQTIPDNGWAFTNIINIDTYGHTVREYPSFSRYTHADPVLNVTGFILDPEYL